MESLERRVAIDAARAAGHLLRSELPGSRHIAYKGSPTNGRIHGAILEVLRTVRGDGS